MHASTLKVQGSLQFVSVTSTTVFYHTLLVVVVDSVMTESTKSHQRVTAD